MEAIYKFAIFKIVPEQLMKYIVKIMGLESEANSDRLPKVDFTEGTRRLLSGMNNNFETNGLK